MRGSLFRSLFAATFFWISFVCPAFSIDDAVPAKEKDSSAAPVKESKNVSGHTVELVGGRTLRVDSTTLPIAVSPVENRLCGLRSTYSGNPQTVWLEVVRKASAISDWEVFQSSILVPNSAKPVKAEENVVVKEEDEKDHDILARKVGSLPQGLRQADRAFLQLMGASFYELRNAGFTHVTYKIKPRRIDTLVQSPSGELGLICGAPTELAPEPPELPAGAKPICNIYVAPGDSALSMSDISPVGPKTAVDQEWKVRNQAALAKTLKKLGSGEQANIVFFGDSITVGGFATEQKASFVERFLKMMKSAYPTAKLGYVVAGVSGSNTSMRMGSFDKDVVALKPDMVCLEFFNDFKLAPELVEANWKSMISKLKAAGIEVLICSPHLPAPAYVQMDTLQTVSNSFYPAFLRQLAKEQNVALCDVSRRWVNLAKEGIKPTRLLSDGQIHPNNYGHSIYASELMCSLTGERAL